MAEVIYATGNDQEIAYEFKTAVGDNVLTCTRMDPYGFWQFKFKRGILPKILEGNFSTDGKARIALQAYLATRKD